MIDEDKFCDYCGHLIEHGELTVMCGYCASLVHVMCLDNHVTAEHPNKKGTSYEVQPYAK